MVTSKNFWLFAVLSFAGLIGCQDENNEPSLVPETLIESQLIVSKSKEQIISFVEGSSFPISTATIKTGVDVYKITYKSHLNGEVITASGLVLLPQSSEGVGMLSFQHGTIASNEEAPTQTPVGSSTMSFYATMASPGFIGVIPDFFGFGSSSDILHPYYVEEATANSVIDNLKAAREVAILNGKKFNGKLFLAGYSQGGYATMAAHKAIEQKPLDNFNLIASFPSSGGYDIKGVQEYFFEQVDYSQPFYLAYVALSYQTHLDWTQPLTDFFQEPYASKIPSLFDGLNSGSDINAQLTTKVSDLVNPSLLANIDTDDQFSYIVNAFNENSVNDFVPKIRMYMYHGNLDTTVPYQNSVDVYNKFMDDGASPEVVTFTTLPLATHSTGFIPYLIDIVDKLEDIK